MRSTRPAHACDAVDRLFGDGEPHPPIFHLLVNYLRGLDADPASATVGRQLAFRLKLLLGAGIAPELGACARCGAAGPLTAFSGVDGGLLCASCEAGGFRIDPALPEAMRDALARPLAEAPDPTPFVARAVRSSGHRPGRPSPSARRCGRSGSRAERAAGATRRSSL